MLAPVVAAAMLVAALLGAAPAVAQAVPPTDHEDAERFLRTARIVDKHALPIGVTHPERATLTDGERTASAVWKTVDIYKPIMRFADGGVPEIGFRDSYKSEVAAYELAKLLGLDFVPPTVERRVRGNWGSLQLFLEDVISESERMERGAAAPDTETWNRQMYNVRLFHNLIDDSDHNNVNNLLIDRDFRIWVIDSSRGFRLGKVLLAEEDLHRFSRSVLGKLRVLSADLVAERLGRWLTKAQIRTLVTRRDLLLELADRRVAEQGEDAVLFP